MRRLWAALLFSAMLWGCAGVTVVRNENLKDATEVPQSASDAYDGENVKTGMYVAVDISGSESADAEKEGEAGYDVTLVAVTVSDEGVIQDCVIDGVAASVAFDGTGRITSDTDAVVLSKNELGEAYGLKKYAGSRYEWNEQAAALARYAVGKTAEELQEGAVNENGYAKDADLASGATIHIADLVEGIVQAANRARHLGARAGEKLKLAGIYSLASSDSDAAAGGGTAQMDGDVVALTLNNAQITSCILDSFQAVVTFDARGAIISDLSIPVETKNAQGEAYGLKKYAGSRYEWNEQAASFAAYATGKTAAQVQGIAINEKGAPTAADLASSVTISIGSFQNLIAKAANGA